MKIEYLKRYQVCNAMVKNRFLALRDVSGYIFAINCAILKTNKIAKELKNEPKKETKFISYFPISFNEYISLKCRASFCK